MKQLRALFGLILAFALLYVAGALLRSGAASILALLLVAGICCFLLVPE